MTLNFIFELLNPMKFDHAGIEMETMSECQTNAGNQECFENLKTQKSLLIYILNAKLVINKSMVL